VLIDEITGHRGELVAYCYRLLGSVHDAEDVVQETLVRAWRGAGAFEGRSSVRRWLYAIATRACLTAIEQRSRRALPSDADPGEIAWLEPLPESVTDVRAGVRLAFVAALQHLPARQRAALILCDVLEWPAAEAATILGGTTAGVTSALQRARARLRDLGLREDDVSEPEEHKDLLDRYAAAFEQADLAALAALIRDDITLEMPPRPDWYAGRTDVLAFLAANVLDRPGRWRMVPTRANHQPAAIAYTGAEEHGLHVLDIADEQIRRILFFHRPQT
jgi:RNA polymerase sigma-70 factor, ECF subfamily